jgi:hypothetical protein
VGSAIDAPSTTPRGEVTLDRPLAFHPSMHLAPYAWAVHELSEAIDARDAPTRRDVALLAYRDAHHDVRWLELTPLAAAIVERLVGSAPLGEAVAGACAALSARFEPDEVAALLADLAARGVCLGPRD